MARILITGSSDGLGLLAARQLIKEGHRVILHARNPERAEQALQQNPGADAVLLADLSRKEETVRLAREANDLGPLEAVIHNAGVYTSLGDTILAVNTLAPYMLTCLIKPPQRLIYLSSGLHLSGTPDPQILNRGRISYSDSKAFITLFAFAVARKWPQVYANSVDPGWVPTKMGGRSAPDNLQKGAETQAWLAVGEEAQITGKHFFHKRESRHNRECDNVAWQEEFLKKCGELTGVLFPEPYNIQT